MKPAAQTPFAERVGRTLGRAWRGFARLERRVTGWLVGQGWAPGVAKAVVLVAKLAVLGVMFYTAFWLALLILFAVTAAWTARDADWNDKSEPEWKDGPAGFGLYSYDGYRIDPHVSDEG